MKFTTDTVLPTTMVGSYPRPKWFTQQLDGRDIRVAFKNVDHAEAFDDATRLAIQDQEAAGLDIVTDGQMYFDDIVGVIGSFCWYWYERIPGFLDGQGGAPVGRGRRRADQGGRAAVRLGRRDQRRPRLARTDSAGRFPQGRADDMPRNQ